MSFARLFLSLVSLAGFSLLASIALGTEASDRWSVRLLNGASGQAADSLVSSASGDSSEPAGSQGMVLRTYQFRNLSLRDGGKHRNVLALLEKLLPQGSEIRPDLGANSLHVLTSSSAHSAVWDFVSTIDVKPAEETSSSEFQADLREELKKMGGVRPEAEKLRQSVDSLRSEVNGLADRSEKARRAFLNTAGWALVSLVLGSFLFLFARRWRNRSRREPASSQPVPSAAQLLVPQQISSALEPMQRQMQQEMLGALNAAAARMEVWYKDQKAQRDQLVQLASDQESRLAEVRSQLLEENRALFRQTHERFEESASRIEQGVQSLALQNDRVGVLAGELSATVRELDTTKDQLLSLRRELETKSSQLDRTRESLSSREGELAKQQAKLAALTLILEEGSGAAELRLSSGALPSPAAPTEPPLPGSEAPSLQRTKMRFRFLPPEPKYQ